MGFTHARSALEVNSETRLEHLPSKTTHQPIPKPLPTPQPPMLAMRTTHRLHRTPRNQIFLPNRPLLATLQTPRPHLRLGQSPTSTHHLQHRQTTQEPAPTPATTRRAKPPLVTSNQKGRGGENHQAEAEVEGKWGPPDALPAEREGVAWRKEQNGRSKPYFWAAREAGQRID